jgi:hypothetical protein
MASSNSCPHRPMKAQNSKKLTFPFPSASMMANNRSKVQLIISAPALPLLRNSYSSSLEISPSFLSDSSIFVNSCCRASGVSFLVLALK